MASITLELSPELEARLGAESRAARQTPESLIAVAIEQYLEDLEDLEDYRDAVRISEEVRSGRMKTYILGALSSASSPRERGAALTQPRHRQPLGLPQFSYTRHALTSFHAPILAHFGV